METITSHDGTQIAFHRSGAGQEHIAMYTAPQLFVHEILTFLLEPG